MALIHKLTIGISSIWPLYTRKQYSLASIIPGPGTRQPEITAMAQSSLELFKLTPPKPFTLFYFVFPEELSIEFPLLLTSTCWPKLGASAGSLGAMWCLPFWGWNIPNFCFPESLLHLLLWPQLTDHHTEEHSAFALRQTTGSDFLLLVFLSSTEAESFQNN